MDNLTSPSPFSTPSGTVEAVALDPGHAFSKVVQTHIHLLAGLGVEGDAHAGLTVKHRSRVKKDPTQPNLRQVHLVHAELFEELAAKGFDLQAGDIGENILTRSLNLLGMPTGTRLHIGTDALVELTGLRNPCTQLDAFQPGLRQALLDKDIDGNLIRKAGVMAVVIKGGWVNTGDDVQVLLPPPPHRKMEKV
ncbi:MOSC domain-containing protein [Magnetovibrio blakemorei]|uniref:Molybdenum cofactor biosysynthesis protein n=1 Tax=Magnetovibrio blakemorei TaxID=28181 RepID=A0A1E5QBV4_9PROT|nr:MOSC domain-containing protein [Magnetovibrio blakemorei]OEJ69436.1 molybdenum cofactor biosysynthesis protein [Magnetovibrio blakemorei]